MKTDRDPCLAVSVKFHVEELEKFTCVGQGGAGGEVWKTGSNDQQLPSEFEMAESIQSYEDKASFRLNDDYLPR